MAGFSPLTFFKSAYQEFQRITFALGFYYLLLLTRGEGVLQPARGSGLGLLLWSWCQGPWQLRSQHCSAAEALDCQLLGVPISSSSSSSSDQLKLSSESSPCAAPDCSALAASCSGSPQECVLLWRSSSLAQEPGLALQSVISTLVGTMLTKLFSILMT